MVELNNENVFNMNNFFEIVPDLLCIADLEGNFIKLNEVWEGVLGYTLDELKKIKYLELIHPEDMQDTLKALDKLKENKDVTDFVNRYRCKNNSYRYIEWYSKTFGGYIYSSARDITEKIEKQIIINEKEENFRLFFETVDDLIFIANENGEILYTNTAVKEKLGYTEEELRKMNILDVHPSSKRREAEEIFIEMFKGLRDFCPLPLKMKNGSNLTVETRIWFGKWNSEKCIYGISKDLSKQQAALEKFHKLFDNNPAPMAVSSISNGVFLEVNNSFLDKLGYSKEEIIGNTSDNLNLFVDSEIHKKVSKILKENNCIKNIEMKIRKKNGDILTGLFSGEVIYNQDSMNFLTVMSIITVKKYRNEN